MLYRVKTDESLSSIARDVLGNMERWPEIAKINGLMPPYIIHPGELILLPDDQVSEPMTIAIEKEASEGAPAPKQSGSAAGWVLAATVAGFLFLS